MYLLDILNVSIALATLLIASISDVRTREVSNKLWAFLGPYALVLFVLRYAICPNWLAIISFCLGASISLFFFYLGMFGGADAKAFICLSLLFPLPPSVFPVETVTFCFPLSLMINSSVLALSVIVYTVTSNVLYKIRGKTLFEGLEDAPPSKKIAAFVMACKVPLSRIISRKDFFPVEVVEEADGGKRRGLVVRIDVEQDPAEMAQKLKEFFGTDNIEVWATPAIPMMVFITAGLVLSILFGDFVLGPICRLLGF